MSAPRLANKFEPTDWWKIDQCVLERCPGIRPHEIDRLTISEIALIISDPEKPRPHGGRGYNMTPEEIAFRVNRWNAMTPKERILHLLDQG